MAFRTVSAPSSNHRSIMITDRSPTVASNDLTTLDRSLSRSDQSQKPQSDPPYDAHRLAMEWVGLCHLRCPQTEPVAKRSLVRLDQVDLTDHHHFPQSSSDTIHPLGLLIITSHSLWSQFILFPLSFFTASLVILTLSTHVLHRLETSRPNSISVDIPSSLSRTQFTYPFSSCLTRPLIHSSCDTL
ncbi:hypothetical protein CROQUDRAFT_98125 [Cronartium quercuum f. sp. fusiforme G11]|uniref:Uncharacterized protein n=1 Tax=Cronartium quercuum f. sp. fusiforme G11 TaxID=708437 RepID=A0A9P6ND23_9BASI|nr:hypothetical protein CROQUDRAFT_98125 [Cronartium quercuum f. sp. fusiforme G11]